MKEFVRKSVSSMIFPFSYFDCLLRPGIRILMYHRVTDSSKFDQLTVSPELFDLQINYLSKNYNVVSLDNASTLLFDQEKNANNVVITFDDGYLDNLENAIPILENYNLPATIFVTTEFCDQTKSHSRYKNTDKRLHLDWDEVISINKKTNFTIGSHTVTHPYLARIENDEAEKEIRVSKEIIENKLNDIVNHFCYPSGDYGKRELTYIKKAGYETAVTVCPGKNRSSVSRFELNRTEITQKDTVKDLYLKLNGSFDLMHKVLHKKRMNEFKKMSLTNLKK